MFHVKLILMNHDVSGLAAKIHRRNSFPRFMRRFIIGYPGMAIILTLRSATSGLCNTGLVFVIKVRNASAKSFGLDRFVIDANHFMTASGDQA